MYDYAVVGAGMTGAVFARSVAEAGKKVIVIDQRDHAGGNCYSENRHGVDVHVYGPHIFHTRSKGIWDFLDRFANFRPYRHQVVATPQNSSAIYPLPINLSTLYALWDVRSPEAARLCLDAKRSGDPQTAENVEQYCLSVIGRELYEMFIEQYTRKQWGRDPADLPASLVKRLPVRLTWNSSYYPDHYEGIPSQGYGHLFNKLLNHANIELALYTPFADSRGAIERQAKKILYTGSLDELFDYRHGVLPYRTLTFVEHVLSGLIQGVAQWNFCCDGGATRRVEHAHFGANPEQARDSVVTMEYPAEFEVGKGQTRFYPMPWGKGAEIYANYREEARRLDNYLFAGRLARYQYMDMDQAVGEALKLARTC